MGSVYKPGQVVPQSGIVIEVGPLGGAQPGTPERTVVEGERFPPTSKPGNFYIYKRVTKHTGR